MESYHGKYAEEMLVVQKVKHFSIGMLIVATLLFLILSSTIFDYSITHSYQYQTNFNRLSPVGKSLVISMKKTGEIESKMLNARRTTVKRTSGKFFDEVANIHRK